MGYTKINRKLFDVGFDEFYQAGSPSKFHPMNIVARSESTNKQYWICVDGGYQCKEVFYVAFRDLDNTRSKTERIYCKNQSEVVEQLSLIQEEIKQKNVVFA